MKVKKDLQSQSLVYHQTMFTVGEGILRNNGRLLLGDPKNGTLFLINFLFGAADLLKDLPRDTRVRLSFTPEIGIAAFSL